MILTAIPKYHAAGAVTSRRLHSIIKQKHTHYAVAAVACSIVACITGLSILSARFAYGVAPSLQTVTLTIGLLVVAGLGYLFLFSLLPRLIGLCGANEKKALFLLFFAGLLGRIMFFGSTPIYEDDWYRYLWDGAVVASGINPYTISPADAHLIDVFGNDKALSKDPETHALQELGAANPYWPERINYPYVTTIYPPLAQAAFFSAHLISPFSLNAWRLVLLFADLITVTVLLALLRQKGRPLTWSMLYWLNPLVIFVTMNTGHMDALLLPFLVNAVFFAERKQPHLTSLALAAAVGVKLWPIILTPVLFRHWRNNLGILFSSGSVFIIAVTIFIAPMALSLDPANSGLVAYAGSWERNSFLFPRISFLLSSFADDPDLAARLLSAALIVSLGALIFLHEKSNNKDIAVLCMGLTVTFFLFSPTGYPWYGLWFFVFLPLAPSIGVGAFALTLPIYYLRFSLGDSDPGSLFNTWLVPFEFILPLAILLFSSERGRYLFSIMKKQWRCI